LPKDLHTLYNDDKEKRIFENIFNGENNTNDINNMWATKMVIKISSLKQILNTVLIANSRAK